MARSETKEVVEVPDEKALQGLVGKDKVLGRPVRINERRLDVKKGKDYAEVIFCGDWHIGYPTCLREKIEENLEYCLQKKIYVLLMGDLMEAGLKDSVGTSVYEQILPPQEQVDLVEEILTPLAKAGLILGILEGNHERRLMKATGVSPVRYWARMLKVPYLGDACWNLWRVGKRSYKAYALHGTSAARFVYTKAKALEDIARNVCPAAHIAVMGHVHENMVWSEQFQDISLKRKTVVQPKRTLILSGHYLGYDKSYAQAKGMGLGKTGSPKVKIYADRHDVHPST